MLLRYLPTFMPKASTLDQVISPPAFNPKPPSEEELRLHSLDIPKYVRIFLTVGHHKKSILHATLFYFNTVPNAKSDIH